MDSHLCIIKCDAGGASKLHFTHLFWKQINKQAVFFFENGLI